MLTASVKQPCADLIGFRLNVKTGRRCEVNGILLEDAVDPHNEEDEMVQPERLISPNETY